jgi:hypothetical protein
MTFLTNAFAAFLFARWMLMRKLIPSSHSKGFFIYDNLLHGGELAGYTRLLATYRRCNITNINEKARGPIGDGMAACHLYSSIGGDYRLSLVWRTASG